MNMLAKKHCLLDACVKHQQGIIANIEAEINEAQQLANDYGAPKDRYDPFRTQMMRRRDMYAQQMQKALDELAVLNKINRDALNDKVELGSIVLFEGQKLFVSVGLGKIEANGESYFAVSIGVPVVQAMFGLKAGDEFEFHNKKTKLLEVF